MVLSSTTLIRHPRFDKCILKSVSNEENREYGFVRFSSQIKRHQQLKNKEADLFPSILKPELILKINKLIAFTNISKTLFTI